MRILFITRKYPPVIGGMERFSYDFFEAFKDQTKLIALHKSQKNLIWWIPYAFVRALVTARKVNIIHIGDGALAWLGVLIKYFMRKPISITVHGLDLTYKKFGYQKMIWSALRHYDAVVCVSDQTKNIVVQNGINPKKVYVIHNGVNMGEWCNARNKDVLSRFIPQKTENKFVLLTVGRLIARKGVAWFVGNVMPSLPDNVMYLITSDGPERELIEKKIDQYKLNSKVKMLGELSSDMIKQLYCAADLFIMPNIEIENDREGFGIVAIEAAASGLPVLASNIEGIRDAVVDGKTGFLIESSNAYAWKQAINNALIQLPFSNEEVTKVVEKEFSWDVISQQYSNLFNEISN